MKRILLILLILLPVLFIFAENNDYSYLKCDGYDWKEWDSEKKVTFVEGFFTAMDAVKILIKSNVERNNPYFPAYNWVVIMCSFPMSVGDVVEGINLYYETRDKEDKLLMAILRYTKRVQDEIEEENDKT